MMMLSYDIFMFLIRMYDGYGIFYGELNGLQKQELGHRLETDIYVYTADGIWRSERGTVMARNIYVTGWTASLSGIRTALLQ